MGGESWRMAAKLCDSCKSTTVTLCCRADSGFLCAACDSRVHAANKLASRHARVGMCDVCEQVPATVTCKADAAALCVTCDRDIHSANPLARRHERFPVVPFYEPASAVDASDGGKEGYFSDLDGGGEAEEAEAASWLIMNPNPNPKVVMDSPDLNLFCETDPYLDLEMISTDQKGRRHQHQQQQQQQYSSVTDGVVPDQTKSVRKQEPIVVEEEPPSLVEGVPCYDVDYTTGSKPFLYSFNSPSLSHSVSSSSLDVGVVPDHSTLADVSNNFARSMAETAPNQILGFDREARVLRYREKRKNRKFEKTIRYASRKAYAETRPRIKGRFAKRSEVELEGIYNSSPALVTTVDADYVVVPSY